MTPTLKGITFERPFRELCARRVELNRVAVSADMPTDELAAMWDALAADFEQAAYHNMAGGCRKRAMGLRGER